MDLGIIIKDRNKLFRILKETKIDISFVKSNYDKNKKYFKIYIIDSRLEFFIQRSRDDVDKYSLVYFKGLKKNDDYNNTNIGIDTVERQFKKWLEFYVKKYLKLVKQDKELPNYWNELNDPIINKYKNEFFSEYQLLDDDADTNTFDIEQQLFLDKYLETIINKVDDFKNENNKDLIDEIKENSKELQNELTDLTKNETVKKLSTIWAKMRKAGIYILKQLYLTVKQEMISTIIKGMIGIP